MLHRRATGSIGRRLEQAGVVADEAGSTFEGRAQQCDGLVGATFQGGLHQLLVLGLHAALGKRARRRHTPVAVMLGGELIAEQRQPARSAAADQGTVERTVQRLPRRVVLEAALERRARRSVAPAGTPAAAIERSNRDINALLADKDVAERSAAIGPVVDAGMSPNALGAFLRAETSRWTAITREIGVLPE